jgi:hypothetical protein
MFIVRTVDASLSATHLISLPFTPNGRRTHRFAPITVQCWGEEWSYHVMAREGSTWYKQGYFSLRVTGYRLHDRRSDSRKQGTHLENTLCVGLSELEQTKYFHCYFVVSFKSLPVVCRIETIYFMALNFLSVFENRTVFKVRGHICYFKSNCSPDMNVFVHIYSLQ